MGDSSFGPMWPSSNPNIVTLVRSDGLRLPLHKELLSLTTMLMDITEQVLGYDIIPGETWGYANRNISGTNSPSNHSQGTADDINAPRNPYASAEWHRQNARGTKPFGLQLVTDIPQAVVELWEKYGYRWGGKYGTKPDPMHFEFMGTVDDARRLTDELKKNYDQEGGDEVTPEDMNEFRSIVQNNIDKVRDVVQNNAEETVTKVEALIEVSAARTRRVIWKSFGKTKAEIDELEAALVKENQ